MTPTLNKELGLIDMKTYLATEARQRGLARASK